MVQGRRKKSTDTSERLFGRRGGKREKEGGR